MKIACILITHIRAKAELRRRERLRGKPFAVIDRAANAMRPPVIDNSPEASSVAAGMTLSQALSVHNDLIVLDSDNPYYNAVFDDAVRALQSVSDLVQPEELGVAHVRIDGLARIYDGETQTAQALLAALPHWLSPRAGVASGKFTAYAAALTAPAGDVRVAPDNPHTLFAPLSANLLPISSNTKRELALFGLSKLKDIAAMTERAMTERFGAEGKQAWQLANGIDRRPLLPSTLQEPIQERIELPYAATTADVILIGIEALLRRLYANPRMRDRNAQSATARGLADGITAWERTFHFKRPPSDWQAALDNIKARLLSDPPAPRAPVDELEISLVQSAAQTGYQVDMLDAKRADKRRRIADAARHISLRAAADPIIKVSQIAPWHPIPEMRAVKTPLDPIGEVALQPLNAPRPVHVRIGLNNMPCAILTRDKRASSRHIAQIEAMWEVDLWWLPQPERRAYYHAIDDRGAKTALFKDETNEAWHTQTL